MDDMSENGFSQRHVTEKVFQNDMEICEWILYSVCGNKTRLKIREDTELKTFPLFCSMCKNETLINLIQLNMPVIKEPGAKTQSR